MSDKNTNLSYQAKVPVRIDLAGGTLDIWPIFLTLNEPKTVLLGIDYYAHAEVEITPASTQQGSITFKATDQEKAEQFNWQDLSESQPNDPALSLHHALLRYFLQQQKEPISTWQKSNLTLRTKAESPAGAGLGGSSALTLAMIQVLTQAFLPSQETHERWMIELARDIEASILKIPTGLQDYFGAMYGDLQSIHWQATWHEISFFSSDIKKTLQQRLLLFHSGQSRNSGLNNWAIYQHHFNQDSKTQKSFEKIAAATHALEQAFIQRDWPKVEKAIQDEWQARLELSSGLTTPEINQAFSLFEKEGIHAYKVCGAGGGGCLMGLMPDSDQKKRERIEKQLQAEGMQPLPFQIVTRENLPSPGAGTT